MWTARCCAICPNCTASLSQAHKHSGVHVRWLFRLGLAGWGTVVGVGVFLSLSSVSRGASCVGA